MARQFYAHLAVFGANLIYGLNYVLAKGPMPDYIQPRGFIFLRVVGALAMFWLVRLFFKNNSKLKSIKIAKTDYARLALCGFFGVCLNQMLFFEGLFRTSEINSSIMMTSNPLIVLILAALLIGEKVTVSKIIGILIGGFGAAMIILSGDRSAEGSSLVGDLLILGNSASYAVYLVLVKPLMKRYNPVVIISWVFLFGACFVIPIGFGQVQEINWNMPSYIVGSILFVIIGTTFFAYLLNIYGVSKLNASVVSAYIYLQPVMATLFALMISYDEKIGGLTYQKVLYTLLIFTGVYLVGKPGRIATKKAG